MSKVNIGKLSSDAAYLQQERRRGFVSMFWLVNLSVLILICFGAWRGIEALSPMLILVTIYGALMLIVCSAIAENGKPRPLNMLKECFTMYKSGLKVTLEK